MLFDNLSVDSSGRLTFAGLLPRDLLDAFGSPLYVMDEDLIRARCRLYKQAMKDAFGGKSLPLYASKACCFKRMYRILAEEGLGADVVSPGEIATAVHAGFDPSHLYFHNNSKSDPDIRYALQAGVGTIVADGTDELDALERILSETGRKQNVLLRITPGIDPHTYTEVSTGQVDSKFGEPIETGQAMAFVRHALSLPHLSVKGFHCHVGSQVYDASVFIRSAAKMVGFIRDVKDACGYLPEQLDLGGGYGVKYRDCDPTFDLAASIGEIGAHLKRGCAEAGLPLPAVLLEPGRSVVADAGITLYTVNSVKHVQGYKNYVAVDGGMGDNPRYALYGAPYTVVLPERMNEPAAALYDVVGKFCESGDILQPAVPLPDTVRRGDILAVLTTGAYNYSMASHYNRVPKPAVVMIRNGVPSLAVRRETPDDLCAFDL